MFPVSKNQNRCFPANRLLATATPESALAWKAEKGQTGLKNGTDRPKKLHEREPSQLSYSPSQKPNTQSQIPNTHSQIPKTKYTIKYTELVCSWLIATIPLLKEKRCMIRHPNIAKTNHSPYFQIYCEKMLRCCRN